MLSSKNKFLFFVDFVFVFLLVDSLSGCVTSWPVASRNDVTNDSRYWGGYKPGIELILLEDVYISQKFNKLIPEKYYNVASSKDDIPFAWPRSFADYLKEPDKYPDLKILRKGINIKCEKIFFVDNLSWSTIDVTGLILNGDFKGSEISIELLSYGANSSPQKGVDALMPNPRFLNIIESK